MNFAFFLEEPSAREMLKGLLPKVLPSEVAVQYLRRRANQAKYRVPDSIHSPSRELRMITGGTYQKVGGSRAIGRRMSINENASHSFGVLMAAIRRFADA